MKKSVMTLVMTGAALGMLSGCKSDEKELPEAKAKINIKTEVVHQQTVNDGLEIPAHVDVDPSKMVHVYAPLSGRLLNLAVQPGQEVRKGQTVAMLQSGDVAGARSDFEKAKIEALRADRVLERGKLLLAHEVMSQAEFDELKAADDAAHSEQERARQRVHELGFSENGTSDTTAVTSPITGSVLDIGTAAGEMQRSLETSNGIATVANLDEVWVVGDVFERDLAAVKSRSTADVTLQAYPGETFHGTVANVGDVFDPQTHALKVRVVLKNPGHRLKPQMYGSIRIGTGQRPMILVPLASVIHDGSIASVYVKNGDKFDARVVKLGAAHGDKVEVTGGLSDGDVVVTQGAAFLRTPVGD
ncbi:efflux RND transporter periplasmic adaptor subunit [Terriglobus tenax]|uniref:efflux RND transporter periplasmic adaptor subunit n=1 Tax=Terriglobus tenax TaxID=1111115 RepID=UPI0021E070F6|nr:efflux RND transporter periplasmic adaptor subunit [Terriglobus tenax]